MDASKRECHSQTTLQRSPRASSKLRWAIEEKKKRLAQATQCLSSERSETSFKHLSCIQLFRLPSWTLCCILVALVGRCATLDQHLDVRQFTTSPNLSWRFPRGRPCQLLASAKSVKSAHMSFRFMELSCSASHMRHSPPFVFSRFSLENTDTLNQEHGCTIANTTSPVQQKKTRCGRCASCFDVAALPWRREVVTGQMSTLCQERHKSSSSNAHHPLFSGRMRDE